MRHQTAVVALFLVFIGGCTIPYKIPLRIVEVNTTLTDSKGWPLFGDKDDFLKRTKNVQNKFNEDRDKKIHTDLENIFIEFGVDQKHFRELSQEEVRKNLSLPENLTTGWSVEQIIVFAERVARFKGYVFAYTDAKKGGYLGFPKFSTEQEGVDAQIIIIADGSEVFNVITPGGPVFPEKQSVYWWEFASDFLRGFVSEGGKETIKQGKKLF